MDGQSSQATNTDQHTLPGVAPGVPTAALPLAPNQASSPQNPVQQAVTLLMNPQYSAHDKAKRLAAIREDYLLKTYGVTIE